MNVVALRTLRVFWEKHSDAEAPLKSWYKTCRRANWADIGQVRTVYPHADLVGRCTVFNIGGNKYRLVVKMEYALKAIFVKAVMTHAEYSRRGWEDVCNRR
ncbi:MAG TPA: type II toxin-antitoxin system HigB family toxin [Blastocatellia bacterium]|nr:type II toxin-antitoxin system HigB family toxin [Blastocatellia bacterium]